MALTREIPDGLSKRAQGFVRSHGAWIDVELASGWVDALREQGVPSSVVDRAEDFQRRWGGLVLPPSLEYDGGPLPFTVCHVNDGQHFGENGWWIEAGVQRYSVPYEFELAPGGEFGLVDRTWVPLHQSIEGWVESLALAHHAIRSASTITRLIGADVADLDLSGLAEVAEAQGVADTWWRGGRRLIAVYRGNALMFNDSQYLAAWIFDGAPEGTTTP
jgi:hypothetical protein